MRSTISNRHICLLGLAVVALALAVVTGCKSESKSSASGKAATQPAANAQAAKGGAQLWAENCSRCHNVRSPSSFSDEQWDVAVMHMRLRAPLTAQEHRSIVEFLKSSN